MMASFKYSLGCKVAISDSCKVESPYVKTILSFADIEGPQCTHLSSNFFFIKVTNAMSESSSFSDNSDSESSDGEGMLLPLLIPPLNFSIVAKGLYRSGFPNRKNHPFLKRLGLKTILYLCEEDYSKENLEFMAKNDINLLHFPVQGNKEPFQDMPIPVVRDALLELLDTRNHPIILHCAKGKHRTGTIMGCLRKLQRWSLTFIFDEYRRYAGQKARALDQEFIELFPVPLFRKHEKVRNRRGENVEAYMPDWLDKSMLRAS